MQYPTIYKIGPVVYESGYALDKVYGSGTMAPPRSVAWFCKICGAPWGWIKVGAEQWISNMRKCEEHGDGRMLSYTPEFKEIPSKILRREILIISKRPEGPWSF